MKRILYVLSRSDTAGGGEIYLLRLLSRLDRSRFEPIVLMPAEGPLREPLEKLGIEVLVQALDYGWLAPDVRWYAGLGELPPRVEKLVKLLRDRAIDLVHTNTNLVLDGALASRIAGVRGLYVCHIEFQADMPLYQRLPLDPRAFASLMGALSEQTVAVSSMLVDTLSPPIPRERIAVIPNGVEIDVYDAAFAQRPGRLRLELGIPAAAPIVMNIGRLMPDKGCDAFVRAASEVISRDPDVHFVHVGQHGLPHYAEKITAMARALGQRFHFLGYRKDIPDLLASSDIFLLTSQREGGPYVLIEAMLTGNAIVTTRCGGLVPDVIEHGKTGLLVDVDDAPAMAKSVLELLAAPERRVELARHARARVHEEFDVNLSVAKMAGVYEDVLARPAPAPGSTAAMLFLRAIAELGYLGNEMVQLKQRLKRAERAADLILDNPVMRLLRRLRGHKWL
ncbi:MAG: glycosyltransferase family 4 protein [Pseudomonadota bacterium]|nr:glycosyltransferase family 4 protein [Pseudomonadota bacterium]